MVPLLWNVSKWQNDSPTIEWREYITHHFLNLRAEEKCQKKNALTVVERREYYDAIM